MPEILVNGVPLDGQQASTQLYSLSEKCRIGECDAFFSHSWNDDGSQKFEALTAWCKQFEHAAQRPPLLWLDKVCGSVSFVAVFFPN